MKKAIAILLIGLVYMPSAFAAKCMLVMSYHKGYAWNDGVERGARSILKNKCDVQVFYMDTKRNKTKNHAEIMAAKAKNIIDKFKPDVLIAADDNASRYLVTKYYKDVDLPVVFCAVNWDVSKYGYPYKNVTGMVEVAPIQPLYEVSRNISGQVNSVTYLGANTFSEKKNSKRVASVMKKLGVKYNLVLADTFDDWKRMFSTAQSSDFIMLGSNAGITGWDNDKAVEHVKNEAKKLTVTNHSWMAPFSMYAMTKIAEEQGEWAAEAALAIVKGLSPRKIPIRVNRKWQTYINTPLLTKIGVKADQLKTERSIEVGGRSKLN